MVLRRNDDDEIRPCYVEDKGGPMVCQENEATPFKLHGVISLNELCPDPGFPGVYTRVSKYVNWIDDQITANSGKYYCRFF